MQSLSNDHLNNNYSDLSSEPLHNGQSGAPRYLLLDDMSPRLNACASNKTQSLTDVSLDVQHEAPRFIPDNDRPQSAPSRNEPKHCSSTTSAALSVLAAFAAGLGTAAPSPYFGLAIFTGVGALIGVGRQACYDRCDGKFTLGVASFAYGCGTLISFAVKNDWLAPLPEGSDTDHGTPPGPP